MFKLVSKFKPSGDQPEAIKELVEGIKKDLDKIQKENLIFKTKIEKTKDEIKQTNFYVEGIKEIIDSQPKQYVR